MKKIKLIKLLLIFVTISILAGCSGGSSSIFKGGRKTKLPHLIRDGGTAHLMVHGEPFLILGGELHNSSAGGFEYMRPIWKRMADANLNTVIGTASWELVEPIEGKYDFALVDSMIIGARKEGLKLVVIWFASWKNGQSTYTPAWVKKDTVRFPLVKDENGNTLNVISTFSEEGSKADARAFAALMKHIKKTDSKEQTVIMMQVENEIGTLRTKRDFSGAANIAFNGNVPEDLINYLNKNKATIHPGVLKAWELQGFKTTGTWEEVFGKGELLDNWKDLSYLTEELFMAWYYARYVENIAKAGKDEYDLPMYVNAWLKQPGSSGYAPGNYPSGGPTPQVIDIWRAAAPSIDFIAPDIYIVDEFRYVCDNYTLSDNPLFIPETTGDAASAARVFFAFGKYNTLGYAPFGIDGGNSGANVENVSDIKDSYAILKQLSQLINENKGTSNMTGLLVDNNNRIDSAIIGGFKIKATLGRRRGGAELAGVDIFGNNETGRAPLKQAGGAIIISTGPGEYYIAGRNMAINFTSAIYEDNQNVSFLLLEEGKLENNVWVPGRRLNGDEFRVTLPANESAIFKVSLYTY